jgi:hypothetical protein
LPRPVLPPGPGRPRGSKNKFTTLKDDLLTAYQEKGGIKYLKELPDELFTKLIVKLLPQEIEAGPALVDLSERLARATARLNEANRK